ncbi:MAG: hypothetical protein MI922_22690, partial [Bacteroidales bacterium]|nr:hypothetical protein [Bacteroidales bacterium]
MDSPNLQPEQIRVIEEHVQKAELNFSHLEADLIDHMCCYVEELMQRGKTFDDALNRVRNEVGLTTLKNIEIETIILLNQKFKAMKTFLKISGITGIGLFLISSIFKINHWPGSVWLMFFGSLFIIFAYTPALLLTLKKEKLLKSNLSLFYSGLAASVFFIGTWMFTINHWPYSNLLRMLFWLSSIVFIVLLFNYSLKKEANRII